VTGGIEGQGIDRRSALRWGGVAGAAVASGVLGARSAAAQTPVDQDGALSVQKSTISLAAAVSLIEAAEAESQALGVPMAIAIVDEGGLLKALHRMDGVNSAVSVDLVQMKANSAASFRNPTHMIAEGVAENPARAASLANTPRFTLLGGGYPIKEGDVVIGGIGVGGGTPEQDQQVAEAALAAVGAGM
jgi:uncharacterized protein GlcG (DUF336 family)